MKTIEQKAKKVPAIRFAGFDDEWVEKKLGDLANSFGYGLNAAAMPYDGINKYLRITDIDDLSREFKKDDLTTPDFDLVKASDYRLDEGDLLFARTGASVGKTFIYKKNDGLVYFAGFLIRTKIKSEYDSKFIFQNTLTNSYDKFVKITSQRSGQPGINAQEYADYSLLMPKLNEQQKIGSFFSNIDSLISLEQKKYDKLTQVKKSMLEKMFPKEGMTVPEIRFANFTGDWNRKKLGEIVVITMGQSPNGTTYSDVPSDFILVQGNADLKDGWVMPRIWTSQKTRTAEAGDLIMSVRAPAGAMGKTAYNVVLGRGVAGIKGDEFIYQTLVKMDLEGCWKRFVSGSTFESLNSDDIRNVEIYLPTDVIEQQKIGSYFSHLDSLISLQQRKLEKLKNIKKSLLEKMFV